MTVVAEPEALSMNALAEHFGVSRQTIYNWKDAGCPVKGGVEAIEQWLQDRRPDPSKPKGPLQEQLLQAQIEKTLEEARAKRLKNDVSDGLLVDQQDAAQQVAEAMTILSARLTQLPDWVRREASADERDRLAGGLDEQIHLALRECAAKLRSVANGNVA
jgi:phage terminase Nu1 subunit (DNA packaging protein)